MRWPRGPRAQREGAGALTWPPRAVRPEARSVDVELVAADRKIWSGEATSVIVRTIDGDLGVLPGHEPVLAALVPWPSRSTRPMATSSLRCTVASSRSRRHRVSLLAETAELSPEIDVAQVERELAAARDAADEHAEAIAASRLAAAAAHGR